MAKDTLHVVPQENKWAVKREGNERASTVHDTQKDAIDSARGLAKDGDDLVIHRPDGTIREHTTYTGSTMTQNSQNNTTAAGINPRDLMSVGTRVSWSAVFAGVVVALTVYLTLNLLAFAIGISTIDQMGTKAFGIGAAIVSTFCLLVSLFIGGYVTSRSTVGENSAESMTYGVLVWSTTLLLLVVTGFSVGVGFFAGARNFGKANEAVLTSETMKQELGLTDQQAERYAQVMQQGQGLSETVSPVELAWWTFGGVILSILAAIGGALAGSGPEFVFKRLRDRQVAVQARPA